MRGTTYVFFEKEETLSMNYPQYPLLSGVLIKVKFCKTVAGFSILNKGMSKLSSS